MRIFFFKFLIINFLLIGYVLAKPESLECNLKLVIGKETDKVSFNISYDETLFNSYKPVPFKLGTIKFIGERKTDYNEFLSMEVEIIESEKWISDILYTINYIPASDAQVLVYMENDKNDPYNPVINYYECKKL